LDAVLLMDAVCVVVPLFEAVKLRDNVAVVDGDGVRLLDAVWLMGAVFVLDGDGEWLLDAVVLLERVFDAVCDVVGSPLGLMLALHDALLEGRTLSSIITTNPCPPASVEPRATPCPG
jgi:hypothetical protein